MKRAALVPTPEPPTSTSEILPLVYDELRTLARKYLRGKATRFSVPATALVHETYLRLAEQRVQDWKGPGAFFIAAARMLRRTLVNYEIARNAQKRGGRHRRVAFQESMLLDHHDPVRVVAMDEVLHRLARFDHRQCQIAELRIFGGLTVPEVANVLGVSARTVDTEWAHARAWIRRELEKVK